MKEFITVIIFLVLASIALLSVFLIVDAGQMSDEKREEYGLGPKGQGR